MDFIPSDPELKQFLTDQEFGQMGETFKELAETGKSLTRLPTKKFDRQKVLEAIQEAFDLIGGVPRFAFWAHHNPTEFYKLYGKTIPAASQIDLMAKMNVSIRPALPRSPLDGDYTDGETTQESSSPRRAASNS